MKRAVGMTERRAAGAAAGGQVRGYLSMHPRHDMGTGQGFHTLQYYYQLPEYMQHRDHKQLRPVELDETNTSEMTREEERIQRLKVMNWRAKMAADGQVDATPMWDAQRADGTGTTRREWSAAQAVEYQLQKGAAPGALDGGMERAIVDPHGVLDAANPLEAAWRVAASARPAATSFRQLLQAGTALNELSARFKQLSMQPFPEAGLDFPAITGALSRGLMDKTQQGNGVGGHRDMLKFLYSLADACASAAPADEFFGHLAMLAALEGKADWFAGEWNHRLTDELSEGSFAKLAAGYGKEGGKGFWEATVDAPEFHPDFVSHVHAMLALTADEVKEMAPKLQAAFEEYGQVFERRLERERRAGARPARHIAAEADWIAVAREYFVQPYMVWAETGDPLAGYTAPEGDGAAEWQDEQDALQAVLDMKVGNFIFSEWLRWEYIGQFVVAEKLALAAAQAAEEAAELGEDEPASKEPTIVNPHADVALASRLANYTFPSAFRSLADDNMHHLKATHRFLYPKVTADDATEAPPFFHFMRCLVNHTNIPFYNTGMGEGFTLSSRAVESFARTGAFVDLPTLPPLAANVCDVTGVVGRMMMDGRDYSLPDSASTAREGVRRVVQAEGLLTALRRAAPAAAARGEGLDLARWAAEDVAAGVGHLRRVIKKEIDAAAERPPNPKDVAVDGAGAWACGTSRVLKWQWEPSADYKAKCPTPEQKATALTEFLTEQAGHVAALDDPAQMAKLALEKVDSYSDEPDKNINTRSDRPEWPFTKLYLKKQHEAREQAFHRRFGVADQHPVKLVLYRKNTAGLAAMAERRAAVAAFVKENAGADNEAGRLAAILQNVQRYVVDDHAEQLAHVSGLSPVEAELLRRLTETDELQTLLAAGTHISKAGADASDALWSFQCDLHELADQTVGNTGTRRVRLPFTRDGVKVEDGTYRVGVVGLSADGEWLCEGVSEEFAVVNTLDSLVDGYASSRRGGRPQLRDVDGRRCLMPVDEVPAFIEYLREDEKTPLEFDLATETRVGGDIIVLRTSSGPEAVVHTDVLKAQLAEDFHRDEAAQDPVNRAANSMAAQQKVVFTRLHPGATRREWVKAKPAHDAFCAANPGWWSYDDEAAHPEMWKAAGKADTPDAAQRHFDRKAAGLFTDHNTPLASARYEGLGYVSQLEINDVAVRLRAAVPYDPSDKRDSITFRDAASGNTVTVAVKDGRLYVDEQMALTVDFSEPKWAVSFGDDAEYKLPRSAQGEEALGALAHLATTAKVDHNIPADVSLQLHHYADICQEVINGAHTAHCTFADAVSGRGAAAVGEVALSQEAARELPTVVKAWQDASSIHAEAPPMGLKQYRRRFDSWQLNSGKGRYDHSPTKDRQWQHPYEDNPTVYGYDHTQSPFSAL
eukprot:TRINITY_DN22401_c0_g1_i1.p1 TRINITY_DN22401_c0_g1~~TRINITY_DN22401_c0_g1_i1.p1  ORF type:complete len:1393 (+),score=574.76 TRINITY_DN22401_c0_g1_i1:73-4251(+)